MGAHESRSQPEVDDDTTSQDYYTILEVDENASAEEIRRSFRRLALIHHPDKNHHDLEGATRRFAVIQQAYEVLSDEQERAWYDSHRSALAPEPDVETVVNDIKTGKSPPRSRDRGLTVRHLQAFLNPSIWSGFDDGENGFFAIFRNLFDRLASDERNYGDVDFPSFGYSTWGWTAPSKERLSEAARLFYNFWLSFVTNKDFVWSDQWNVAEAPDRHVRRLMEKDNKKARDAARKEYNETVRTLVMFVRKRDPRYKAYTTSQGQSPGLASTSGTGTPKKPVPKSIFVAQEWQKVAEPGDSAADLEWAHAEGAGDEEWECIVCNKGFRSEAAWNSHERSKRHLRAVEELKREMQNEELELELGQNDDDEFAEEVDDQDTAGADVMVDGHVDEKGLKAPPDRETPTPIPKEEDTTESEDFSSRPGRQRQKKDITHTPAKKASRKGRVRVSQHSSAHQRTGGDPELSEENHETPTLGIPNQDGKSGDVLRGEEDPGAANSTKGELSKREKRRAREVAKKARESEARSGSACNFCGEAFESRTKLFEHINREGHAEAKAGSRDDENTSKKRGKKTTKTTKGRQ